jgi:L-iditol 2-dehydrogenase
MKVAVISGKRAAGLVERPSPTPSDDFVLVKIHLVPMCTEYKDYTRGRLRDGLGHEAVGEVVEVAEPGGVEVGDRVVVQCGGGCGACALCQSGDTIHCLDGGRPNSPQPTYAQYMLQRDRLCSPIPDEVSYKYAGVALCGLGPSFGAMQLINVEATDTVLITGLGPVGLGGVINGSYRGARVIAVESVPYRAELGRQLGAEVVLDPRDDDILEQIMDLTGGVGVDKALDFSGAAPAHRLMIDATRRKGHVAFIGEGGEFPLGVSRDMIRKGLVLHGSWHYNLSLYPHLMRVIHDSTEKLDQFITHSFPMSEVQQAFEVQSTGACGKVMLDPWR